MKVLTLLFQPTPKSRAAEEPVEWYNLKIYLITLTGLIYLLLGFFCVFLPEKIAKVIEAIPFRQGFLKVVPREQRRVRHSIIRLLGFILIFLVILLFMVRKHIQFN